MNNQIKILAVDDEQFNLLLLKSCLKGDRFQVGTCTNAIEALNLFKQEDYEVVLLDILMEGIDGFGVRKLIREINPTVPIIFLTSVIDDINSTLLNRIADDQYSYYMNKAFNQETLIGKIDQAVSVYREQRNASQYYHKLEENLALAEDVQRIMLPNWCQCNGQLLFSYYYKPSMEVSGDMLELITLDNHRSLLFIGDIAGHGIQAALYMSALQSYLKLVTATDDQARREPHVLLNRLESFFSNELGGKTYMTCLVAIFDFRKNHLSFQSAGHPSLICCNPQEAKAWKIDDGGRGGLPVSLVRDNVYKPEDTVEYDFSDNTMFLAYTDGIMDLAMTTGEDLPEEVFLSMLGSLAAKEDLSVIPFRINSVLHQIGYTIAPDDIAIAAIQKIPKIPNRLCFTIRADTSEVSDCVATLAEFIQTQTGSITLATSSELLLSEFLNNVIVHGLDSKRHTQTDIFLRLTVTEKEIRIRIMDRGKEWHYNNAVQKHSAEILDSQNKIKATSGRGLAIIYSIADTISRNHYSGLNDTLFIIRREGENA